ncbi:ERF family protein [Kribbella catacumbae]|uniref:ERF family protein n=1 Tax=Kribbella catacumbae TaxID=460086 RepID=UPI00037D7B8E|nr:ERF family protein [Kribbella catacumbae]
MTVTESQPAEVGGNPPASTYEPGVDHLAAALAAVQAELPRIVAREVAKVTGETKQGKPVNYSYKYAGLATVADAIMPMLGKHGLSFVTCPTLIGARFVLRYELLHSSGQRLGGLYPLAEDVRSPQAMGSQITYARRYCLCAMTGVSPEDDDDAAAAEADRATQRADQRAQAAAVAEQEQAQAASELNHAVDAVRGAWALHYGEFNQDQAQRAYHAWSKGGTLTTATAGQLRSFAAYLSSLPAADAGSDPSTPPPSADPEARQQKLSKIDNGHMFVLFEKLGMTKQRAAQLEYLSSVLGRTIKSRGEVMQADAAAVLKALKEDVDIAERTGLSPQNVSEPAAGAHSASGETRVPAGEETASGGA